MLLHAHDRVETGPGTTTGRTNRPFEERERPIRPHHERRISKEKGTSEVVSFDAYYYVP